MIAGGFGQQQNFQDEHQQLLKSVKSQVEAKTNESYKTFQGQTFSSQVVAGTNYSMKVLVDNNQHLEVKVFKPLPHTNAPAEVTSVKKLDN